MFEVNEDGVWFLKESGGDNPPERIWVCSNLKIIAVTRDHNNENHGRLLEFVDSDNVKHSFAMPMELLAGDCIELRKTLLSMGLEIGLQKGAKALLVQYIQSSKPEKRLRCVNKVGWHNDTFVFPNECIPDKEEE